RFDLRETLQKIANSGEYIRWNDEFQYDGRPFLIPPGITFDAASQQRVLENVGLVRADELRTRISLDEDSIFLTDGLWVPRQVRVYPFRDESDLLLKKFDELGWRGWPTTVVEPGVGCGHTLLRIPGVNLRRIGFDVSTRATSYCLINALL